MRNAAYEVRQKSNDEDRGEKLRWKELVIGSNPTPASVRATTPAGA